MGRLLAALAIFSALPCPPSAYVFLRTAARIALSNSSSPPRRDEEPPPDPSSWRRCSLMISLRLTSPSFDPNRHTFILPSAVILNRLLEEQNCLLKDIIKPTRAAAGRPFPPPPSLSSSLSHLAPSCAASVSILPPRALHHLVVSFGPSAMR